MTVHIGVDVGGTFTDFAVSIPEKNMQLLYKLPSTPERPDDAIIQGLNHFLTTHKLEPKEIVRFGHGTTVGTNALIQRRVGKVAMVTSRGFKDLLEIGRQTRPKVYDMHQDFPKPLVPRWLRYEVSERMRADGVVHTPLDEPELKEIANILREEQIDCIAVCFLHSHAFPEHEERAAEVLRQNMSGDVSIMTSSMVYPEFREYERFSTTVLNAALLTVMSAYLDRLTKNVAKTGVEAEPTISQSGGGLMSAAYSRQYPIRSALSGPAAGVLGAAYRAKATQEPNIITLDIGGTSADVSLLADGEPSVVHSRRLAGFPLRLPALDVNPACYNKGGVAATVTDANVILGRLPDTSLLDGRMDIRRDLAEEAIDKLAEKLSMSREDTALGIVQVASSVIVKAIRAISVERGHDPSKFSLFAFGGAGPLHAIDVAKDLGIKRVFIPPNPGILCAEGLLGSDLVADLIQPSLAVFDQNIFEVLNVAKSNLSMRANDWFAAESVDAKDQRQTWSADLRYAGQNFELAINFKNDQFNRDTALALRAEFDKAHEVAYGYSQSNEPVELVGMRVKLAGILSKPPLPKTKAGSGLKSIGSRRVSFGKNIWTETPIYRREAIPVEQNFEGPAVIEQMDSMLLIFPGDTAKIDGWGNLIIDLGQAED